MAIVYPEQPKKKREISGKFIDAFFEDKLAKGEIEFAEYEALIEFYKNDMEREEKEKESHARRKQNGEDVKKEKIKSSFSNYRAKFIAKYYPNLESKKQSPAQKRPNPILKHYEELKKKYGK